MISELVNLNKKSKHYKNTLVRSIILFYFMIFFCNHSMSISKVLTCWINYKYFLCDACYIYSHMIENFETSKSRKSCINYILFQASWMSYSMIFVTTYRSKLILILKYCNIHNIMYLYLFCVYLHKEWYVYDFLNYIFRFLYIILLLYKGSIVAVDFTLISFIYLTLNTHIYGVKLIEIHYFILNLFNIHNYYEFETDLLIIICSSRYS